MMASTDTTPPSARVALFLRQVEALSTGEREALQSTPEFEYFMARLKFRADEPVPVEQIDLALDLAARYPHPLDYYRQLAERATQRQLLADRLAASVPFKISARACR